MYEYLLIDKLLEYIREDLPYPDITTRALIIEDRIITGRFRVNEDCVVAGVSLLIPFLKYLGVEIIEHVPDGVEVQRGTDILVVRGSCIKLLELERTLQNLLMVTCGIATKTRRLVEKIRKVNPKVRLAATRKTHPGLRFFEKYAVQVGGGDTHRLDLSDMVLIKKNHVKLVGSVREAVKLARSRVSFTKKIEVEVTTLQEAIEAAEAGADIIMLDNFTPEEVERTVTRLRELGLRERVLIEVSGGITEDNILDYARLDIDIISTSEITLKARPIDMRFVIE